MTKKNQTKDRKSVQIIPLGGLGEIGKNMMAVKYQDDIIIIDAGLGFPSETDYGINYIIPKTKYLIDNQSMIKGIILTHGHEDHIGGLQDFLKKLTGQLPPIYGTKLTMGLVQDKLSRKTLNNTELKVIKARDKIKIYNFNLEVLKVCHSIADSIGLAINTPIGTIIHTGDFKLDPTPVDNQPTDYYKFSEYGEKGVLLLLSDSTNATKEGHTLSEKEVTPALINSMGTATGKLIVTTFASNIHRVQQILDVSTKLGRKVALFGRSMERIVKKSRDLGYLHCSPNIFIRQSDVDKLPPEKVTILATGSQGEPMSVLTRIAKGEYKVSISEGDTVILSALPIPGNEKKVSNTINKLIDKGAEVIYESHNKLHVSGHASIEELKLMLNMTKPKFFVPIHGEARHLKNHGLIAEEINVKPENIFILKNGDVLEINSEKAKITGKVPSGKIYVDGYGRGYAEEEIIKERYSLARDGAIFVSVLIDKNINIINDPIVQSKGFIYDGDIDYFYETCSKEIKNELSELFKKNVESEMEDIEDFVKDIVNEFCYKITKRKPYVIPTIQMV